MTAKNRATLISKLHTVLKKHFKPAPPSPGRPLMEHVLYASLLEDTPADLADEGFAKCEQEFFDWNEVRVTTVTELAEVLSRLPSPTASAIRLKKNLQSMFEAFYNFDIDHLKKENLGKAVAKFEAMPGMTHFVLSYLIQHGLGGHAIPIDKSAMKLMWLAGIVTDAEADSGKVPGLERTIPKNRAIEFSSLLHQAGIAFQANNKDKAVWEILLAVNKDAKALFERPEATPPAKKAPKAAEPTGKAAGKNTGGAKQTDAVKSTDKAKPGDKTKPAKAPVAKPATGKAPAAKTSKADPAVAATLPASKPPAKPASVKPASAKPASVKPASVKEVTTSKPVSEKATVSAKPVSADNKAAAKPSSEKPSSEKPSSEKPKKGVSEKASGSKAVSPKAPAKQASKKSETKPVGKKPVSEKASEDSEPAKKGVSSANKKLTKQKPR